MPADLQPYYSSKRGYIVFNPYTGILTCATVDEASYVIAKYSFDKNFYIPFFEFFFPLYIYLT